MCAIVLYREPVKDDPSEWLLESSKMACRWLTDIAQVRQAELTVEKNIMEHPYSNWQGAIRGEYYVASKQWVFLLSYLAYWPGRESSGNGSRAVG